MKDSPPPETCTIRLPPPETCTIRLSPPRTHTIRLLPPETCTNRLSPQGTHTIRLLPPETCTIRLPPPETCTIIDHHHQTFTIKLLSPDTRNIRLSPSHTEQNAMTYVRHISPLLASILSASGDAVRLPGTDVWLVPSLPVNKKYSSFNHSISMHHDKSCLMKLMEKHQLFSETRGKVSDTLNEPT